MRKRRQRGGDAPDRDADRNHQPPVAAIRITGDRKGGERIEGGEGDTGEQPELRVVEPELDLDIVLEQGEDLTIDIAQDSDEREQTQGQPPPAGYIYRHPPPFAINKGRSG